MDISDLLAKISSKGDTIGLGGCKNHDYSYDSCEYNVTVFDGNKPDEVISSDGIIIKIHHNVISDIELLPYYDSMKILRDEQWELHMILEKIKKQKIKLFLNKAKSCLIESIFCISKANESIKNSDPLAACWIKSSAFFLADAISLINLQRPSPAHFLHLARNFKKNKINKKFSIITDCIGTERATSSLLERMCKSTIGFSDMLDETNKDIIKAKYTHMSENSFLSDCYFYLGYINRDNLMKIQSSLYRRPDLIHILKTAFDIQSDVTISENQAKTLHFTANELLYELNAKSIHSYVPKL